MELRHLRSFVTVAATGSVTGAARQLNLAQPAVSQHIQALELELGVRLFNRGHRGVTLTEDGLALVASAHSLLSHEAEVRSAVQRFALESHAGVEVAAIPSAASAIIAPALGLLSDTAQPFRLRLYERTSAECLALLAGRFAEFAIVRDASRFTGFQFDTLMEEPMVLAIAADHPLAALETIALQSLASENWVMFDHSHGPSMYRTAVAACAAAGFIPKILCEGPEIGTMGAIVALGIAVAIAPGTIIRLWPSERIRVERLPASTPPSVVQIATLPGQALSPGAQRVLRAIRRIVERW